MCGDVTCVSCCGVLKMSGDTSRDSVGGTFQGLTHRCRPSLGPGGPNTGSGFRRVGRTGRILDSPRGHGGCSRCNRR